MNNDLNNNVQNEFTENERYTFCYTPDEYKEIFKLCTKKAKINSIVLTILFLITAIVLMVQYEITFGIFMILFAFIFTVLQIHRFGQAKRKLNESHNQGKEDIDVYEIAEDKIIYSNYLDGELTERRNVPYSEISFVTENDKFLQYQFENKIYSIKKSELKEDSLLHGHIQEIKDRMKKQSKYIRIGALLTIIAILSATLSTNFIRLAENYFMSPSYWICFPFLIFPAISLIYAFVLKKKKYPYIFNLLFGIIMSIILIVCGCQQFFYMNYFGDSADVVASAEEKLGIEIPESEYIYFYNDNYSDDENIEIIYDTEIDYYEDVELKTDGTVWLDELPDEFIDVIPDTDYYIYDDYFILYNVDTGEINKIPTENGENRMVFMSYCIDDEYGDYMTIIEYIITI